MNLHTNQIRAPTHRRIAAFARIRRGRPSSGLQGVCHAAQATSDVVALGNLCVDVVLPVDQLPPSDLESRRHLLATLTSNAPQQKHAWEVGGNCNFILAAARIGLKVTTVGHAGDDMYGKFMEDILKGESVQGLERILHDTDVHKDHRLRDVDQTLLCFVLVDPQSGHAFCSRYDFGPWPLLGGLSQLPPHALKAIEGARSVFLNGFVFDELPLESVRHACKHAIAHGASVFFDPGPRCFTMLDGDRRHALEEVLDLAEVVLMTEEEAVTVTGHSDPEKAAQWILARPNACTKWCVVKLGAQGALLCNKTTGKTTRVSGFRVEVQDTVGCGDSFAAAIVDAYVKKLPEEVALTLANAVGAATATGRGAGRNVASASMVKSILAQGVSSNDADVSNRSKQALDHLVAATVPAAP